VLSLVTLWRLLLIFAIASLASATSLSTSAAQANLELSLTVPAATRTASPKETVTIVPTPAITGTPNAPTPPAEPSWRLPDKASADQLNYRLARLVRAKQQGQMARAARESALELDNDLVLVDILSKPGQDSPVKAAIMSSGGRVVGNLADSVTAYVPVASLPTLVKNRFVRRIDPPTRTFSAVESQGLASLNGVAWKSAGFGGEGIKIGIIDPGFRGYVGLQGIEIPVVNIDCSQSPIDHLDSPHGTAVAEIVHDIAPQAQLFLAKAGNAQQVQAAITCLAGKGVSIINHSANLGYGRDEGPGNGDGEFASLIDTAVAAPSNIFWVNSSGNRAEYHWRGGWQDQDVDRVLNFSLVSEANRIRVDGPGLISVALRWDDAWGGACHDYDLYHIRMLI
jgi:hypothetical protein